MGVLSDVIGRCEGKRRLRSDTGLGIRDVELSNKWVVLYIIGATIL